MVSCALRTDERSCPIAGGTSKKDVSIGRGRLSLLFLLMDLRVGSGVFAHGKHLRWVAWDVKFYRGLACLLVLAYLYFRYQWRALSARGRSGSALCIMLKYDAHHTISNQSGGEQLSTAHFRVIEAEW